MSPHVANPLFSMFTIYPNFHVGHLPHFSFSFNLPHLHCLSSTSFLHFICSSVIAEKLSAFLLGKCFCFLPFSSNQLSFGTNSSLDVLCTLELLFLPCFLVTETFSVISKCHCYRPNLPKFASPTVYWHQTLSYRFHCTLHHIMLSLSLYRFGYVYVPKSKKRSKTKSAIRGTSFFRTCLDKKIRSPRFTYVPKFDHVSALF